MIAVRRPLSAAKDSGVQPHWEVPPHWEVRRIKTLFREKDERRRDGSGLLLSLTKAHGLVPQMEASHRPASSEDLSKYKLCRPGDMVMNRMQAWSGMLAVSSREGLVSPDYSVFAAIGPLECRFFEYLFKTRVVVDEFAKASKGIGNGFNRLYTPEFGAIPVAVPPLAEQVAIVRFLDHADRRIQRCIRAKRKLIELLEEQKQAIIHRAVTRGLDPNVRVKPSGVEWLGDVPEHWEVRPLKSLVPEVTVGIVIQPARLYVSTGVPCLRSLNISDGVVGGRQLVFISAESNRALKKSQIFAGDIVIVRTGQAGVAAIVTPEFDGANCIDLLIVRASARLKSEYALAYLNSWAARTDVQCRSVGAIQAHYNTHALANLIVPVPPLAEQQAIADAVAGDVERIEAASAAAQREIDLLREYRSRLIADVVTGKLDVREASGRLPDEGDEHEPDGEVDGGADEGKADAEDVESVPGEIEA
ncbi:MAG: restriction endonuclease subunit S [Candidatus Polarisedimenticolia bacterium]